MSPVMVVARRELGAMFRAPLAYVFLVLFLVVAQLPHVMTVFLIGQAQANQFFDWLPWFIVVFAALVTMRSWAEERQDNTYEMLLTFPMKDRQLVLGKWVAAFVFLAIGLAGTLAVPIMLFVLGKPDSGPIVGGYVGALLLAAMATAAGVFFSSLTRSQLLAVLLSLVVGFLSLAIGTTMLATLGDAVLGGLGSPLRSCFSPWLHYDVFTRGVLELADVLFFVVWTVVFLHLNTLFLALRRVSDSWPQMLAATALGIGCGALSSRLLSEGSLARADLTQDKLYTLSPGTLAILAQAQVPVQVKFYVSPADAMPSQYKRLERDVSDLLNEIQVASHGKLQFSVLHMNLEHLVVTPEEEDAVLDDEEGISLDGEAKKPKDEKKAAEAKKSLAEKEKSIERRLLEKGVHPFTVQSVEATEMSSKMIFSTIGIAYREKDEEYVTLERPERLMELEYSLANIVSKLVRARPPKIALVTGEEPMDPQQKRMIQQMGQKIPDPFSKLDDVLRQEKFDVEKINLSAQQPMPDDYDALVVIGPTHLDERQKWEIGRALRSGRPTLIAAQRFSWDYRQQGRAVQIRPEETDPGLDDLLEANGLGISRQVLMDESRRLLNIGPVMMALPIHVFVTHDSMNAESEITKRLNSILYLWGSSLDLDNQKLSAGDFKHDVLLSSSSRAWPIPPPSTGLREQDIRPDGKELKSRPLAVLVQGQFKDPMADEPRPKWPPKIDFGPDGRPIPAMPDKDETPAAPAKGKLILTGCSRMWSDWFVGGGGLGNMGFLLNCIDSLTSDENLLQVRSKQPTDRSFEKPKDATATLWTVTTLLLVPLFVVIVGVFIAVLRFRRREKWNAAHGRWRP